MTTTSQEVERTKQRGQVSQARLFRLVNRVRELGLLIVLLLITLIVGIQAPRFLSIDNFEQILLSVAILAIVAVGETLVVLTRNVDLSVGSMVGITAFVTAYFFKQLPDTNVLLGILVAWFLLSRPILPLRSTPPMCRQATWLWQRPRSLVFRP